MANMLLKTFSNITSNVLSKEIFLKLNEYGRERIKFYHNFH